MGVTAIAKSALGIRWISAYRALEEA